MSNDLPSNAVHCLLIDPKKTIANYQAPVLKTNFPEDLEKAEGEVPAGESVTSL